MDYKDILKELKNNFIKLNKAKKYPKGPAWNGKSWDGWETYGGSVPPIICVYILWNQKECVYIGETENLGTRLHEHFYKLRWDSVQFLEFPNYTNRSEYQKNMRFLLERYAITALEPVENIR
jgi:hypothetical protein